MWPKYANEFPHPYACLKQIHVDSSQIASFLALTPWTITNSELFKVGDCAKFYAVAVLFMHPERNLPFGVYSENAAFGVHQKCSNDGASCMKL